MLFRCISFCFWPIKELNDVNHSCICAHFENLRMNALNILKRNIYSWNIYFFIQLWRSGVYDCGFGCGCGCGYLDVSMRTRVTPYVNKFACLFVHLFAIHTRICSFGFGFLFDTIQFSLITAFVLCIWNFEYFMQLFHMQWTNSITGTVSQWIDTCK